MTPYRYEPACSGDACGQLRLRNGTVWYCSRTCRDSAWYHYHDLGFCVDCAELNALYGKEWAGCSRDVAQVTS